MQLLNKMHMNYIFPNWFFITSEWQSFIKVYDYFCFFASLCFNKNIRRVSLYLSFFWSVLAIEATTTGVLLKKGIFKDFANFTGKRLCWSLFLINLQASRSATLLKKGLHGACFPVKTEKCLRTAFSLVPTLENG